MFYEIHRGQYVVEISLAKVEKKIYAYTFWLGCKMLQLGEVSGETKREAERKILAIFERFRRNS